MKNSRSHNKKTRKKSRSKKDFDRVKSIQIFKKLYYFDEDCEGTWLQEFNKLTNQEIEYYLDYDDENVESCLLGQGGSGFVLKYTNSSDKFAIKFITNKKNRDNEVKIIHEIQELFKDPISPNFRITQYISDGDISIQMDGRTLNLYYIIMDLADGTINDLMCKYHNSGEAKVDPNILINQIKHLAETIHVLHSSNYAHRDIKPENILLKGDLPVLADFALSGRTDKRTIRKKGPKYWPNPEFVQACNRDLQEIDEQSDIFNLGCLFFYFFTGKYPIGLIDIDNELNYIDPSIKGLLLNMLCYSKEDRLKDINDAIEIFEHAI